MKDQIIAVAEAIAPIPQAVVAGGAARAVVYPDIEPGDIDVFTTPDCQNDVFTALDDLNYLQIDHQRGRTGSVYTFASKFFGTFLLPVQVVVLSNPVTAIDNEFALHVIRRFAFTAEQFYLTGRVSSYLGNALHDTATRRLVILENALGADHTDPIRVARRLQKYGAKGFTITAFETAKLFTQWDALTLPTKLALVTAHREENHGYGID